MTDEDYRQRCRDRAREQNLTPLRLSDQEVYFVQSCSEARVLHEVHVEHGDAVWCTCRAWRYGRDYCAHCGAVYNYLHDGKDNGSDIESLAKSVFGMTAVDELEVSADRTHMKVTLTVASTKDLAAFADQVKEIL